MILCDISAEYAENGKKKIAASLSKLVQKGKMEQSAMDGVLSRIDIGLIETVGACDLVLEATLEKMELKQSVFSKLQEICKKDCVREKFHVLVSAKINYIFCILLACVITSYSIHYTKLYDLLRITNNLTYITDIVQYFGTGV